MYVTLGEEYEGQRWSIHAYYKPFITLLWLGLLVTVLGGLVAFGKRFAWVKSILPIAIFLLPPTFALDAHEQLKDPALESRARSLSQRMICPVCQGQLLDESPIAAAAELRAEIRQALSQGKTDRQILDNFIARYGNQVIINPAMNWGTYVLWFGPWIAFGMIVLGFFLKVAKGKGAAHF